MGYRPSVLVVFGGGGTEHDISIISAGYITKTLREELQLNVLEVLIDHQGVWNFQSEGKSHGAFLAPGKKLVVGSNEYKVDIAVPCIHGPPGETGEIQSHFQVLGIPYIGADAEASIICFNKVTTKLWFDALKIPNTPYMFLESQSPENLVQAKKFLAQHKEVFVKASSQGSSVGCYQVLSESELLKALSEAFKYSPYVLIEKRIIGRELEISVFEYNGLIHASHPGEIVCPGKFYSFEEKYSQESKTTTLLHAEGLDSSIVAKMQDFARRAFGGLKIRHLSRVDFFLTEAGDIYLNEINTFPGLTPISMFPKMMESSGTKFADFLNYILVKTMAQKKP